MDNGIKKRGALLIFGASVIACACIGVLLRTLSIFFFYDADIGYFSSGALLPILFNVLIAVACIACAVLCFMPKTVFEPENSGKGRVSQLLYIIPCIASIYTLISQMTLIGEYSALGLPAPRIETLLLVFNALAVIYFALSIFGEKINSAVSVILGVCAMLWLIFMLVSLYFDMYVQINSPNKTMMAFALSASVLFLVSEIRLPLDTQKPKIKLFTAAFGLLLLSTSSIPTLIAHFTGAFGNSYYATVGDIICLSLLFPVSARFIKLCFAKEPDTCDTVKAQEVSDAE